MVRTLIAAIATMLLGCGAILSQIAIATALPVPSAGIPLAARRTEALWQNAEDDFASASFPGRLVATRSRCDLPY
jgi:hypothetical protein